MNVFIKTQNKQLSSCHTGICDHRIMGFGERFSGRLLRSSLLGFTQACSMCVYAVSPEPLNYDNVERNDLPHTHDMRRCSLLLSENK